MNLIADISGFAEHLCTAGYMYLYKIFLVKLLVEEGIFCKVKDDMQVYLKLTPQNKFCQTV